MFSVGPEAEAWTDSQLSLGETKDTPPFTLGELEVMVETRTQRFVFLRKSTGVIL